MDTEKNTSSDNSTSMSSSSTSALPDKVSTSNSTSEPPTTPSTVNSTSSITKTVSNQSANNSGIDTGPVPANDGQVSKPDRAISSRTTNDSISDSRASTDGRRTPNADNLSKTNLYIRGLSTNTTDEVLYNLCSRFGCITSTKAILDKMSGICRGYGFVQFQNPRAAEIAVQELTKSGVQAQMARISPQYSSHNQHPAHPNQNHHFHHNNFHSNHQNNGIPHRHHYNHPNSGNNHNNSINTNRNINNSHTHSHNANNNQHINNDPDPTNLYIANLPLNMNEHELGMLLSNYGPVVSTRILRDVDNRSKGVGFARMESRDKCQEIIDNLNGKTYKGSSETLLVKFADGGIKKWHQHNSHHHKSHYSHHHHQQHTKGHSDDNRWRESGNTSGDDNNTSSFDQQGNIPHGNQMSDLAMMSPLGYHRLQPTFPPTIAHSAAFPGPMGPSPGAPQWIHPSGPGQPWNLIPQQIIPTSGLAPSNQGAAAFPFGHMSQLASQMQGLQISHHSGAPIPDGGYLPPQWAAMWPHPMQPHQPNQSHSLRLPGHMPHLPPTQQPSQEQLSQTTTASTSSPKHAASIPQQEFQNETKQAVVANEKKVQVSSPL